MNGTMLQRHAREGGHPRNFLRDSSRSLSPQASGRQHAGNNAGGIGQLISVMTCLGAKSTEDIHE
jgi:hypothetical protein